MSFNLSTILTPPEGSWTAIPDFADAIDAQYKADYDLTSGRVTSTIKVYGSMVSRGIVGFLKTPYQDPLIFSVVRIPTLPIGMWLFPPTTSITTMGNLIHPGDVHEYLVENANPGKVMNLSVTVTSPFSKPRMVDPYISLWHIDTDSKGNPIPTGKQWAQVGPSIPPNTHTRAHLGWSNLPAGYYSIQVTGTQDTPTPGPGKAYYTISISLR